MKLRAEMVNDSPLIHYCLPGPSVNLIWFVLFTAGSLFNCIFGQSTVITTVVVPTAKYITVIHKFLYISKTYPFALILAKLLEHHSS